MPDSTPTLADAAVGYAQAGWKVLPVEAKTKRPLTRHGVLDASDAPGQVRSWWNVWPHAAIATPTGEGLLVVDIDPRNGGRVQDWMPETRTARTQSGGLHMHYRIDEDIKSRANLFGPGIDSKCSGGYVLIPPSPGYEWTGRFDVAGITRSFLEQYVWAESFPHGATGGAARKHPMEWRKGMIHDQVIAWAGYLATECASERELREAMWEMIESAKAAGCPIDNAGNHINSAIQWVWNRESNKSMGPSLA